jgi:hypothetical protein
MFGMNGSQWLRLVIQVVILTLTGITQTQVAQVQSKVTAMQQVPRAEIVSPAEGPDGEPRSTHRDAIPRP